MCLACWKSLPRNIRREYLSTRRGTDERRGAMVLCLRWLIDHPRPNARSNQNPSP